ncbi:NUC173-domain-containing protein [Macrolepiota fuliginosa MF-IS2]|uniref:NUC173-domain-containing protein n=1 Tax=Macrolepiota fuliginosa MF-IS2 TaxID=1400762 RepID=A0A9P6CAB9_9AGAR|nr:NUC173-domain-containing protein [Macrolepiota fuliginosa MF-IS2]
MEDALAKIRPHTSSSLPHQKTPATLLIAIESTFKEQSTNPSPTAYFAALLTTLDGTLQRKDTSLDEGAVLPAELYLLALIAPFVSKPVIRTHLTTLLNLTAPLFPILTPHAPPIRSQLSLYHAIFQSLDRSQLDTLGIRQTFASILSLCIDPRPKVRRKAADVVKDALCNPPSPLMRHPYAERTAEWVKAALTESSSAPFGKGKSKQQLGGPENAIHVLTFLRPVLSHLPPSMLPQITELLLHLPRLGNPYLSQSSYSILSDLFTLPDEDGESKAGDQLPEVLRVVLSSPPTKTDTTISPVWVQVLGDAMQAYGAINADACDRELSKVWKAVWNFLDSNDAATRKAVVHSLSILIHCCSSSLIATAVTDPHGSSTIPKIISQVSKALENIAYARSMPELLAIISALVTGLKSRTSRRSPTAAEVLLLPLIAQVGDLRTRKSFEHKEAADVTLGMAMQVLGPKVLLQVLPLNLEPEQRKAGGEPRAYLLPLLTQPHPSPLGHFVSYFVPLSERMFDLQQTAETEGRQSEAKVWSVLVGQVWTGLAGYCYAAVDLKEALSPAFAQLLSQLLYSQTELRPAILKALKVLVESNQIVSRDGGDSPQRPLVEGVDLEEVASNIAFLKTQAESWLAVLFNVFGSVNRDSKGMVGDVISAWASIADEQVIAGAYRKVIDLFRVNLGNAQNAPTTANSSSEAGNATAMTQDILVLLLPYLSRADANALFEFCLTPEVLSGRDNGVQKRGYKILAKLAESKKVDVDVVAILKKLDELLEGLTPAAKKDRFNLLSTVVSQLPSSALHVIPSIIPEVVLGTKEPSEKARGSAFDVILVMGRKMSAGGIVKRNLIDGMDEDTNDEAVANIEEFMTMVAGGLAGASPHMISATVTAISRLVFEFKDTISPKMHTEILQTLLVFLTSANREIVKSVLGFIKLAIHTLPTELLRPYLGELVPALLKWSHDHKNHFKVKVRHIFERMLRRFNWEEVYTCAGNDETGKVLLNIKKRKDRAKRKKTAREEAGEDEDEPQDHKPTAGDAFEDVLYGSESELEDSDEDGPAPTKKPGKRKNTEHGTRLRLDDEEPMDLLQGAAGHVTNAKSNRRRKPGQDAAHFKTDDNTGKMVIDDDSNSGNDNEAAEGGDGEEDVAGNAYKESMTSVDGFTRGPGGRIKFNKDTKKRRREDNDNDDDIEMADGENVSAGRKKSKNKEKNEPRIGHEFKAKRAGGDVKKHGVDPYAYLSLSEASKRGKSNKRIGITSKR